MHIAGLLFIQNSLPVMIHCQSSNLEPSLNTYNHRVALSSNTETYDYFGAKGSLSADGNTLAAGAQRESSGASWCCLPVLRQVMKGSPEQTPLTCAGHLNIELVYVFSDCGFLLLHKDDALPVPAINCSGSVAGVYQYLIGVLSQFRWLAVQA